MTTRGEEKKTPLEAVGGGRVAAAGVRRKIRPQLSRDIWGAWKATMQWGNRWLGRGSHSTKQKKLGAIAVQPNAATKEIYFGKTRR